MIYELKFRDDIKVDPPISPVPVEGPKVRLRLELDDFDVTEFIGPRGIQIRETLGFLTVGVDLPSPSFEASCVYDKLLNGEPVEIQLSRLYWGCHFAFVAEETAISLTSNIIWFRELPREVLDHLVGIDRIYGIDKLKQALCG